MMIADDMDQFTVDGTMFRIRSLRRRVGDALDHLPFALRLLAENALCPEAASDDLERVIARNGEAIGFRPSRLILQDMLAMPFLLDLMALRETVRKKGNAGIKMSLTLPVDLVIDHSMTIEKWAGPEALAENERREFEVNKERFAFFKACETEFDGLRIIPPGGGIMHQVNLEYLSKVVEIVSANDGPVLQADTVLGTDSHTTMVNGLGVLGWGIGGLDAERIALGRRLTMNVPEVVGLRIEGSLSHQATATDIALITARLLREADVVGAFVELCGDGYKSLSVPDRATIANMAPEYGATCVYCPIDEAVSQYLRMTGRRTSHIARVETWARHQGLWREADEDIEYDRIVNLDLSKVGRTVSGPARPDEKMPLLDAPKRLAKGASARIPVPDQAFDLGHDDVIIAAITSCTNTANPRNMVIAGLLARNATNRGLRTKPWVKTSFSPGSRVVAAYLRDSGLQADLDALGFHITGFACTTCNGMSGPLRSEIEETIIAHDLGCAAVLSGNRNFPGRIHPLAAKNVLASPPLVVAYALAGSLSRDIANGPLGHCADGDPVALDELWPDEAAVNDILDRYAGPASYRAVYRDLADVSKPWTTLPSSDHFVWPKGSNYISRPPYLDGLSITPKVMFSMKGLRPLVILGDNITTDHISPSGYIPKDSAAGQYLSSRDVPEADFNSFGTRRGSNDIVVRSAFSSIKLRNEIASNREGPWTRVFPTGQVVSIFDAIKYYRGAGTPLIVIAGKFYGAGSSRDTAAKAPKLAGVRAVVAESFERIHRSNLINMGIAPLLFPDGVTRKTLALDGSEMFDLELSENLRDARLIVFRCDGDREVQTLLPAFSNDAERETYRHGGALPEAARELLKGPDHLA